MRRLPRGPIWRRPRAHPTHAWRICPANEPALHKPGLLSILDGLYFLWPCGFAGGTPWAPGVSEEGVYEKTRFAQHGMRGTALGKLPPHIFALAERAFSAMLGTGAPQAIVISGESGAGKTEGKRQCVLYLMARGTLLAGGESEGALERQLVQVNPLLEALGNASTTRDFSSR